MDSHAHPPEAIEKVEEMAGSGSMEVTFTYRNVNYSTADSKPQQGSEDDEELEMQVEEPPVDPTQED